MSSNSGSVAVRVYLTCLHLNKMIIPVIRIPVLEFLYVILSIFSGVQVGLSYVFIVGDFCHKGWFGGRKMHQPCFRLRIPACLFGRLGICVLRDYCKV